MAAPASIGEVLSTPAQKTVASEVGLNCVREIACIPFLIIDFGCADGRF
jgi:hypothetical protein